MLEVWKGETACLSVTMVDFLCVAGLFMLLAENGILSQVVTAMLMMSRQNTTIGRIYV